MPAFNEPPTDDSPNPHNFPKTSRARLADLIDEASDVERQLIGAASRLSAFSEQLRAAIIEAKIDDEPVDSS